MERKIDIQAERKQFDLSTFKFNPPIAGSDDFGSAEGCVNKMFIVDDGADIVIGYEEGDFLKRGFVADTHGMGNGSGTYTTATEVGMPKTLETRNGDEIYSSFIFHDANYAQECRKVMSGRAKNNLVVPFSIGYDLVQAPIFIPASNYTALEFSKYIPSQYVDRCLAGAKGFPRVRLIKVKLNEYSTVPIPMNTESQATGVKTGGAKSADGETWLSGSILDYTTFDAVDSIFHAALWCCYGVRWDGDSEDPAADYAEIMQEAFDLIMKIIPAIMGVSDVSAEEMKSKMIAVFGDPLIQNFKKKNMKDGIDRTFKADMKDLIEISSYVVERGKQIAAKNAGKKNAPFDNVGATEEFKSLHSKVLDIETMMTIILPELKAGAALSAASKKKITDHADDLIAKCNDMKTWANGDSSDDDDTEKNGTGDGQKTATEIPEVDLSALAAKKSAIDLEIVNRQINSRK